MIGQMWRDTPDSEKQIFQGEYDVEKVRKRVGVKDCLDSIFVSHFTYVYGI